MQYTDHEDLRQAARDEIEIVAAGLYDRYRDQLDYEIRQQQPAPIGSGPLSQVHGDRWRGQRKARQKRRDEQAWLIGCNLAHNAGVGVNTAIAAVKAAHDDVRRRVRERYATAARVKLAGLAVESEVAA